MHYVDQQQMARGGEIPLFPAASTPQNMLSDRFLSPPDSIHNSQLLNNSGFSEDLLNSSLSSITPNQHAPQQRGFAAPSQLDKSHVTSYDVFDRFVLKVGIVIQDVDNILEKYPSVGSGGLQKKLEEVKREANSLCRMIRTIDHRNEQKLLEAEARADSMAVEASKLKEEVESLLTANAEMFEKLVSHGHSDLNKGWESPRRGPRNVNESALIDAEDKLHKQSEEYAKLKENYDNLVKEKLNLAKRCSNLQQDLDDVLGSYQDVVEEKVNMQYEMLDSQKEVERRVNFKEQVARLRQREVRSFSSRAHWARSCKTWRES